MRPTSAPVSCNALRLTNLRPRVSMSNQGIVALVAAGRLSRLLGRSIQERLGVLVGKLQESASRS